MINYDWYSVRWTGKLKASQTGKFKIGVEGIDGYRLYINNELLINNWKKQTYQTILADYYFVKDKVYDIKVEFFESVGNMFSGNGEEFKDVWFGQEMRPFRKRFFHEGRMGLRCRECALNYAVLERCVSHTFPVTAR